MSDSAITVLDAQEFRATVGRTTPTVVLFGSPRCHFCRATRRQALTPFAERYPGIAVLYVDIDNSELALLGTQNKIRVVPTVVVYRGGQKLKSRSGELTLEQLEKFVDKVLSQRD